MCSFAKIFLAFRRPEGYGFAFILVALRYIAIALYPALEAGKIRLSKALPTGRKNATRLFLIVIFLFPIKINL
ncbi:hypothetical protein D0T92_05370 [Neisseria zalophi]|uniref:Uncharacterized protein n=1 Tax=Neisseria zalophi TaxID=640030 RepID=A0A5J6PUJ0_9NEIS|nr:hypothetical protein D0T92_05370 [Neisseria zalophi]